MAIDRLMEDLKTFSQYGKQDNGGITRLAYSSEEHQAKQHFISLCRQEGMTVRCDQAGNVIARRSGMNHDAPAVACGSHLDSVINGGNYDGAIGVLAGLEVVRRLNENHVETAYPIEIIVFACEESSRFGVSTVGSKAMSGQISLSSLASLKDAQDISFKEAVEAVGLSFEAFPLAQRSSDDLKAFIELHIEQGPVLEKGRYQVGVVKAIAAPTRYAILINGEAGHSGTTTMGLRRDALAAAAEVILAVERLANQESSNHSVGTVGVCRVHPGAANTIPGKVELIAEFRSVNRESKQRLHQLFFDKMEEIKQRRKIDIDVRLLSDESPVELDSTITGTISNICASSGYVYHEMVSGAGHDAMNMASLCPTGLIFIPSVNGISHHPDEFTRPQDIAVGVDLLYQTVLELAEGTKAYENPDQTRKSS
jgi:N-carbamoyl-L-amino-acid hydrolase